MYLLYFECNDKFILVMIIFIITTVITYSNNYEFIYVI